MKIMAVIFLLAVSCQNIHARFGLDFQADVINNFQIRSIADKIREFLETFKTTMKTGNSSHGIPVLDPFQIKYQKVNLSNEYFSFVGSLGDVFVQDLSNYDVLDADFKIAKWNFTIDLQWPSIKGHIGYDLNGKLFNTFPVYGAGDFEFEVNNFRFAAVAKLKMDYKAKKISVLNFDDLLIYLGECKVKCTGLYYDQDISELASALLSDVLPSEINDAQESLKPEIKKVLMREVNKILDKVSINSILGRIL